MSDTMQEQQSKGDADKRREENRAVYEHIRGLIQDAYGRLRTVDWDGLMVIIEPLADKDEGEAVPMFRTVRDFMRAFKATTQGADLEACYVRQEKRADELADAIQKIFKCDESESAKQEGPTS